MNLILAVAVLLAATLLYTLFVRSKDIPPPEPVSPTRHLDERKAIIYENLRDLQFEYRVGKLSDADYAQTKLSLQKELAVVIAETERVTRDVKDEQYRATPLSNPADTSPKVVAPSETPKQKPDQKVAASSGAVRMAGITVSVTAGAATIKAPASVSCPHCGTAFSNTMRFCGHCGKEMDA